MNEHTDTKIQKFLDGLSSDEMPQADLKPGDPQHSALFQYLVDNKSFLNDKQIIDFGSGRGVLAKIIDQVWLEDEPPLYLAVDLPPALEHLSLPRRVHNRSRKITVQEFYDSELSKLGICPCLVVVRNVLHELDIDETAKIIGKLIENLSDGSKIYIQDLVTLPRAERGCAGWLPELLKKVLVSLGQDVLFFGQSSFSGTDWFALFTDVTRRNLSHDTVANAFAQGRSDQLELLTHKLSELVSTHDADAAEITQLNFDIASIHVQLSQYKWSKDTHSQGAQPSPTTDWTIPLVASETFAPYDYADATTGPATQNSGLVYVLSNKKLVRFADLFSSARERIMMMGYSQRSLFHFEENLTALLNAMRNGARVRLLIARPDGSAAQLRAVEPVYSDPGELQRDIDATLAGARRFASQLSEEKDQNDTTNSFEVRLFDGVPHASYFIVDDLCFMSLYSRRLSGSRGVCLVFRDLPTAPTGYFNVLIQDFEKSWEDGRR